MVGSGLISCISGLIAREMADDLQCSSVNGVRANSPFDFSPSKLAHQVTSIVHGASWATLEGQPLLTNQGDSYGPLQLQYGLSEKTKERNKLPGKQLRRGTMARRESWGISRWPLLPLP